MSDYLDSLELSALPLPLWLVAMVWLVAFVLSHLAYRRVCVLTQAQSLVNLGDPETAGPVPVP